MFILDGQAAPEEDVKTSLKSGVEEMTMTRVCSEDGTENLENGGYRDKEEGCVKEFVGKQKIVLDGDLPPVTSGAVVENISNCTESSTNEDCNSKNPDQNFSPEPKSCGTEKDIENQICLLQPDEEKTPEETISTIDSSTAQTIADDVEEESPNKLSKDESFENAHIY